MPPRLPVFLTLLLLSGLLLAATGAHGASAAPKAFGSVLSEDFEEELEVEEGEGEWAEAECETAREEAGEGELELEEADEICTETTVEAPPSTRPNQARAGRKAAKQRAQRRKKACRGKQTAHRRRCARKSSRH